VTGGWPCCAGGDHQQVKTICGSPNYGQPTGLSPVSSFVILLIGTAIRRSIGSTGDSTHWYKSLAEIVLIQRCHLKLACSHNPLDNDMLGRAIASLIEQLGQTRVRHFKSTAIE